ncbi:MAG: hypothetical protein ABGZ19_05390 [Verrucomicrobiales bacterium]
MAWNSYSSFHNTLTSWLGISILLLHRTFSRTPDMYWKHGVYVEILYFQSAWVKGGLISDDEFTPYIFNNGKLAAVGWQTLGGIKSQALGN